jgi:hypothetical protein
MKTKNKKQCARDAEPGALGLCWQHLPAKEKDREKWQRRIEGATLAVMSADLLIKIVQIAVEHLPEFFGDGDDQTSAKHKIESHFPPTFPELAGDYKPGARVDWKTLLELLQDAERATTEPSFVDYEILETKFDRWFEQMNEYHKGKLLEAIASYTDVRE